MRRDPDKTQNLQWGRMAEEIAERHLIAEGYLVRERNWRPNHGHLEVDRIVEKGGVIVFVEVKARAENSSDPIDAVDMRKQRNLTRAADQYLRSLDYDYDYRFDIVAVTGNVGDYTLEHIPDAFLPPLASNRSV